MSDAVIEVEGIGKKYEIGTVQDRYPTLRDVIVKSAVAPFRRLKGAGTSTGGQTETMWALRDVSFQVQAGDKLGIIGRNGAGKSTLLKILTRITHPTEGRIALSGSVGSLLEVGTGFHPELTGRENIYLNGAVLGMKRAEVRTKFDQIVEFSEIGRYLDTPVKRYSSGMYVRLAFAVAAHLEPDILIVDEVLAVGDFAFQKKCLGRMTEVAKEGRTVLFVSHNMGAISALCSSAMLLEGGELVAEGRTTEVVGTYISRGLDLSGSARWDDIETAPGDDALRLRAVRVVQRGQVTADVNIDEDICVEFEYWNLVQGTSAVVSLHLIDSSGVTVFATMNMPSASLIDDGVGTRPHEVGVYRAACTIPGNFLNDGLYKIHAFLVKDNNRIQAQVLEAVSFTVHDTGAMRREFHGRWIGAIRPRFTWFTELLAPESPSEESERDLRRSASPGRRRD